MITLRPGLSAVAALGLVLAACGGTAAPSSTTTSSATTTTSTTPVTTTTAGTTTTLPPTTTTTLPDFDLPTVDGTPLENEVEGATTFTGNVPMVSGGETGVATAIQEVLDAHLAGERTRFTDAGFAGTVTFAYEVMTTPYTMAFRLIADPSPAAPVPGTVIEMTFDLADGGRLRLSDLDGLSEVTLSTAVLSMIYEQLLEVVGDAAVVDTVFSQAGMATGDRFAATTTGIEITVTAADGLPAGFDPVTMAISWDSLPEPAWSGADHDHD